MAVSDLYQERDEAALGGVTATLAVGVLALDLLLAVVPALLAVLAAFQVLR